MKFSFVKGSTSLILTVFIQDSSSTTGAGLGSLDQTSSIVGGYVRMGGTGVALAVDENVTTEGTYQAPSTAAQVRIGTPANMRTGTYELHFHNDLFAVGAKAVTVTLGGATNMADLALEILLTGFDLDVASAAQTADNNVILAHADYGNAQLVRSTTPANTLDINATGEAGSNVQLWLGTAPATPTVAGVPEVDLTHMEGVTQSVTDLKDFADAGYDPATNKVQGVVLVDTVTAADLNADQSGVTIGTVNNVTGLVAGTGGISVAAESFTVTTGSEIGGSTFADTRTENGVYHIFDPAGGITDGYYQFDVTNAGVPQSITLLYYAQSQNDTYTYSAYNWSITTFEPVKIVNAFNGTVALTTTPELLVDHVGTGANAGKVRLQVSSTTGTRHAVDRIFCTYTQATSGIPNGSTITLAAAVTNQNFVGHNWNLILAGQTISGAYFQQATSVTGIGVIANGNPATLQECNIGTTTLSAFFFAEKTNLSSTLTLVSTAGVTADSVNLIQCNSGVAGDASPTVDASGVTKTTNIQNRKWGGGYTVIINSFCVLSHEVTMGGSVTITNAGGDAEVRGAVKALTVTSSGSATTDFVCTSGAPITVNGTGGTVNIYGMHNGITDNSGATVTINDLGADITDIPAILLDTGTTLENHLTDIKGTGFVKDTNSLVDLMPLTHITASAGIAEANIKEIDDNAPLAKSLKEFIDANVLFSDTAQAGGAATITLAAGTSLVNDDLEDFAIYLNGGTGAGEFARIESVVAATQVATINTPVNGWATIPDPTTTYVILSAGSIIHVSSLHAAALTEITTELDTNATFASEVTQALADTNELQTNQGNWLTATGFNTVVPPSVAQFDARTILSADYFDPASDAVANVTLVATTTTNTDMRGTDSANTVVPDVAGTANTLLGTNGVNLTDLGGMSASMKAEVVVETLNALTTQMTESYAADGVAPTYAEALFQIMQFLHEPTYAGVTLTVKKLDGTTTAMTFTMDDATNPTTHTRAT